METQIAVTLLVLRALERLGIDHMLVGSMAVFVHGFPRGTRDADVVADLRPGDAQRIAAELGADFYFDIEMAEEAIRRRESASAIHMPSVFKIDIFALKAAAYDVQALARKSRRPIASESEEVVSMQAPEDTLISKLKWYRLGGEVSDQQWRDIIGVLQVQGGRLDEEYLKRWAEHEKVDDLLEKARRDAVI